jgi:hypothetical protein
MLNEVAVGRFLFCGFPLDSFFLQCLILISHCLLRCAMTIMRQYIITSAVFKLRCVAFTFLSQNLFGCRVSNFLILPGNSQAGFVEKVVFPFNDSCCLDTSSGSYIAASVNLTPWSESASELYRPSDRRLLAKWLTTFADKGCHVVSVTDPYSRILGFLDRSRYFSIK